MYRYRVVFIKEGEFICLSHLDLQRTFIRVLRRSGLPLAYSQGYNPQPRLSFAAPLAVGIASDGEYLEFDLVSSWESQKIKQSLNRLLPRELEVRSVQETDAAAPLLASQVEAALYLTISSTPFPGLAAAVEFILASSVLEVERQGKNTIKLVNIRPLIYNLYLQDSFEEDKIFMFLATGNQGGTRPAELMKFLPLTAETTKVCRRAIFICKNNNYITPEGERFTTFLE